jgi:type II secretion system protein I
MIAPSSLKRARPGISLLEVLAALSIFLISFAALGHLVQSSADRALDVQLQSQAARLAQSKLHEVVWGIEPLSSSSGSFDDDPNDTGWQWTLDCEQGNITNLWNVTVTVHRDLIDSTHIEFTLNQMVLDPSMRGSTFDTPAADTTPDTNTTSGSSGAGATGGGASGAGASGGGATSGAGGGATSRPATSGGAGAMPSGGGATRPTSGGGTGPTSGTPTTPKTGTSPKTGP